MRVLLGWIHATTLHNCARPTTRLRTKMVRLRHTMNDATNDGTNDSYISYASSTYGQVDQQSHARRARCHGQMDRVSDRCRTQSPSTFGDAWRCKVRHASLAASIDRSHIHTRACTCAGVHHQYVQLLTERLAHLENGVSETLSEVKLAKYVDVLPERNERELLTLSFVRSCESPRIVYGHSLNLDNFPKAKRGVVQVKTVAAGLFADKAWRKRQCVLQDNFFFLYKPGERTEPVETIRLDDTLRVEPANEKQSGKSNTFKISTGGSKRMFYICAATKKAMAKWMLALMDAHVWYKSSDSDLEDSTRSSTNDLLDRPRSFIDLRGSPHSMSSGCLSLSAPSPNSKPNVRSLVPAVNLPASGGPVPPHEPGEESPQHSPISPGHRRRGWTLGKKWRDSESTEGATPPVARPANSLDEQQARAHITNLSPREPSALASSHDDGTASSPALSPSSSSTSTTSSEDDGSRSAHSRRKPDTVRNCKHTRPHLHTRWLLTRRRLICS